jgi:protein phosphatase
MLKCNVTAASRVGCIRDNNEDMILVGDTFIRDDSLSETYEIDPSKRFLMALADGMGGHNSGEVASSDVLHNLQFFYSDIPSGLCAGDFNEVIYEWLTSMNNILEAKGRVEPALKDMGTTLVALALYENNFYWMNCGDSRLYRFRNGKLEQLSIDHSLSNLLGEKGHSNVITNCIGGGCDNSYIDIVKCTSDVKVGDMFLLCSDGLSDMVSDRMIENLLNDGADASQLCDEAENAGGHDNVSVALITIGF